MTDDLNSKISDILSPVSEIYINSFGEANRKKASKDFYQIKQNIINELTNDKRSIIKKLKETREEKNQLIEEKNQLIKEKDELGDEIKAFDQNKQTAIAKAKENVEREVMKLKGQLGNANAKVAKAQEAADARVAEAQEAATEKSSLKFSIP